MMTTGENSQVLSSESQQEFLEETQQRYAHIRYEEPDTSGCYIEAFAWVVTLEQIAERVSATLPYQFELFGGGDVVTLNNGQLNVKSSSGYVEVFDIEKVTQVISDVEVVYAIDAFDFSTEELHKIQKNTYTQDDKHLWDAHEALEDKQAGDLGAVALLRGPILYREDLVRIFMEDNEVLGTYFNGELKYTLGKLGHDGKPVFDHSHQYWVHDLDNDPLLPEEEYWVPVEEWLAA